MSGPFTICPFNNLSYPWTADNQYHLTKYSYISDIFKDQVLKFDMDSKQIVHIYKPTGVFNPNAPTKIGNFIYVTGRTSNRIMRIDPSDDSFIMIVALFPFYDIKGWKDKKYVNCNGASIITVLDKDDNNPYDIVVPGQNIRLGINEDDEILYCAGGGVSTQIFMVDMKAQKYAGLFNVGQTPRGMIYNHTEKELYVTCAGTHDLYIIDTSSGHSIKQVVSLPVSRPVSVVYDTKYIYVLGYSPGTFFALDINTRAILFSQSIPSNPLHLYFDKNNDYVWFVNSTGRSMYYFDSVNFNINLFHTFSVADASSLESMAYDPQQLHHKKNHEYVNKIYSASLELSRVDIINSYNDTKINSLSTGINVRNYGISRNKLDDFIYIAKGDGTVINIDPVTDAVVHTFTGMTPSPVNYVPISIMNDGFFIYVANGSNVAIIRIATKLIETNIPMSEQPGDIAFLDDDLFCYATNPTASNIVKIDTGTRAITLTSAALGGFISDLVISKDQTKIFALDFDQANMYVLDASTLALLNTVDLSTFSLQPVAIEVSIDGIHLYIGYNGAGLSVLDSSTYALVASVPGILSCSDISTVRGEQKIYVSSNVTSSSEMYIVNTVTFQITNVISYAAGAFPAQLANVEYTL